MNELHDRETQHLIRCAIALVAKKGLSEVAGESRAVIAHKLELLLAATMPSEIEPRLSNCSHDMAVCSVIFEGNEYDFEWAGTMSPVPK